jgi:citrate lyase beta subunit
MIETPLGVLRVADICEEVQLREQQGRFRRGTARPSLTTLCMGFADLGKELHAPHVPGRHNFATSAQLCVLAARAYGLTILDGVHLGAFATCMAATMHKTKLKHSTERSSIAASSFRFLIHCCWSELSSCQKLTPACLACLLPCFACLLACLPAADLEEMEEFEAECLQGVQFGMDGKTLIHPKQIAGANIAYAPSAAEVEQSRRMIEAHAGASGVPRLLCQDNAVAYCELQNN